MLDFCDVRSLGEKLFSNIKKIRIFSIKISSKYQQLLWNTLIGGQDDVGDV